MTSPESGSHHGPAPFLGQGRRSVFMGMENIPRANHAAGVLMAPSVPEQPLDTVSGSGQGFGKNTPIADGEGDIPTMVGCWQELCSR